MQGGNAPVVELNQASLQHVRKLLKQMLQDAAIPNVSSWEKALMPILLQCTDDVNPDVQHNDDIDIRHYIKLKKIPGGRPSDTSYVSGVVFTKKVALKSMPRSIPNPRIIIVTFAIEYARHQQHFMSLEPVIAQEREYLLNLVNRIAALQPHVLLVQRNVSGLALEFLAAAGIAVVYNVKPTVLNAVARCTQSRMISSVDKLAIDPSHLGSCESFDVKTYVNKNSKKTFICLSGCQKDLGCTIVLRGAETETLRKLKRVAEFMCYVVYNLKLETCLMRDEFVLIPSVTSGGTLTSNRQLRKDVSRQNLVAEQHQDFVPSDNSQDPTPSTVGTQQQSSSEVPGDTSSALQVPHDGPAPSFYSEMVDKHNTKILSASPFVKFMQPYLLMQAREQERKLGHLKRLRDQYSTDEEKSSEESPRKFELVQPEMVHTMVEQASKQVRDFLHAVHAAEYDKALHNYQTQKRQWEAYLSGNMNLFDPFNHQKIAVLYSVVNSVTSTPCIGPEIIALGFYHEHDYDDGFTPDCTLGQYVEDLCHTASTVCDVDGCNRRMLDHHRQYVHGEGQMSVIVQKYPSKIRGLQNTILMWSCCRVCGQETQVIPMSENTWKYSFAKYLELTFWSSELHPRADVCPHDIHKNHVRYFGLNNIALRIQYDVVQLYEVIVPRPTVAWKVDSDLNIKNEQFLKIEEKLDRFMASVRARLKSIHVEGVAPEKVDACRAEVEKLLKRANEENEWLRRKLQDKYMSSRYYEIIPLNRAIRAIQEKAIAWDDTFADFEHQFFPSEKDIRRLAALQLKKLFLERDESTSSLTSVEEGAEPSMGEVESVDEKGDGLALTPMPSSMSAERAHDMLSLVVEEDSSKGIESHTNSEDTSSQEPHGAIIPLSSTEELPIQTPIEALEREDVRHLDLAVPSNFPESPMSKEEQISKRTANSSESRLVSTLTSPPAVAGLRVNPIDTALGDAMHNMQLPSSPPHSSNTTLESKIPRLVDTIRRESNMRPTALLRTQSQPGNALPKRESISAALPSGSRPSPIIKTDTPKLNLSDSARALEKRMSDRLGLGTFRQAKSSSMIPRSVPRNKQRDTNVSTLRLHFEQLSREFQKERMREWRQRAEQSRQARAYPLASSKPTVEVVVYRDLHEAVQEHNPSDEDLHPSSPRASTDTSTLNDSPLTETTGATESFESPVEGHSKEVPSKPSENEDHSSTNSHPVSDVENEASDSETTVLEEFGIPESIDSSQILSSTDSQLETSLELPKHEKTTLMKMLTSFWSERSASGWTPLDYPFAQNEHVWEDSDIIVREDEPSSIIALALSSPDYLAKLQTFRADKNTSDNLSGDLTASEASIERNLLHQANTNIRYGFTNRGVKAQCKIFYAQSFDALRRKCGVADRFVESLSRCSKWDSKGGKSKSIFLKTLDDRFVVKSLSPIEVNAFFRFAPNYFAFTHQNLFKGLPSVIAKMFGLFQVQIKTPSGRDFDWFMLVMENLFYDRNPNRRYDLKGSMRNRKIQSTGERDEVLLDENLVDIIYSETPIFVREHTKKLLKASVWNDTLFLSQQNVMDYSLMAGFDDTRREIIVGIIDCIRTYTWDKKLESWIKDRGKNKPTITSPKDYRNRFRIAMEKYILQAPNCWHQFNPRVGASKQMRLNGRIEENASEGMGHGESEVNSAGY
jgi:1-phosphatidylinositol-3-phosphate 5-kinase